MFQINLLHLFGVHYSVGPYSIHDPTEGKTISTPNDSYIRPIHNKMLVRHNNNFYTYNILLNKFYPIFIGAIM